MQAGTLHAGNYGVRYERKSCFTSLLLPPKAVTLSSHYKKRLVIKVSLIMGRRGVKKFIFNNHLLI